MSDNDGADDEFPDFESDFDPEELLPELLSQADREIMFGIAFCNFLVQRLAEDFGEEALVDLICAADRYMGWSSEIVANKAEIDNLLFERHNSFDQHIWQKVQETKSWSKMRRQVYKMTRRYLASAVDEVVQSELLDSQ